MGSTEFRNPTSPEHEALERQARLMVREAARILLPPGEGELFLIRVPAQGHIERRLHDTDRRLVHEALSLNDYHVRPCFDPDAVAVEAIRPPPTS